MPRPAWREMRAGDIRAALRVADRVHPDLPEGRAVFEDRMALFAPGCLVLDGGRRILGYALSHPWILGEPPALDTCLGTLPSEADTYYIHDVALAPEARGTGAAASGVERLLALAGAYPTASLVSVHGTASFWSRFGFAEAGGALPSGKLAAYGLGATYMVRPAKPVSHPER